MDKKQFFIINLFMLFYDLCLMSEAHSQIISTDAEWPCFRRDAHNTGISNLVGSFTEMEEQWTFPLGGGIHYARMQDVDQDGFDEIFIINNGKVLSYQEDGTAMWASPILDIDLIFDIVDLDNDGHVDIVSASSEPPTFICPFCNDWAGFVDTFFPTTCRDNFSWSDKNWGPG